MQLLCITILIGSLARFVARWVTPRNDASGSALTIMADIAGALAAAFSGQLLHWYESGQLAGFAGAVVSTAILPTSYHMLAHER